jgi:uncharacterized protein
MIQREGSKTIIKLANQFKTIVVTGPKQSGKTTLVRALFPEKPYVSLENPDTRSFAINDPRGFLGSYPKGAILDEAQRTPELFSYLQERLDATIEKGLFILTGSNNFLLQQSISQSLAGRAAYFNLLPFTTDELKKAELFSNTDDELMIKGFYPPVYDQEIPSPEWSRQYISTYIEKDVRQIKNISDLLIFERFLVLLAGRCAQELNMNSLANETGVDTKTVQSWIGILESSFIIFLLRPYFNNYNKTVVKRPKLFFYDTSIVCSLLRITETIHLVPHPLRGAIFENMVVSDILKSKIHHGLHNQLYYWRDKAGHEIDLIIDAPNNLLPIEIKSGKTISQDYFKNIRYWKKLSSVENGIILYGGEQEQKTSDGLKVQKWSGFQQ